ncbi:adenylate cyclase type 10 isoform X2 [Anolis carolinensis]|uniref:adenylate cyclase type 10 isoform X2 n=1 Tax=Anolis carolinensis TaxID=28377 RepID=UPI002F2B2755
MSANRQNEISALGKAAAHVPDLIVYGDFSQEVPFIESFDGVLLFVDISGFTALTEKFSTDTKMDRGADELTQTLNHYVGDIVEEVLVFGGDVLKFAGDALLALWKVERCHISDIITLAVKCSFSIQQEYGVRDTEVGLELRVKIGLSAGHISKVILGDNKYRYFLVIGRAVDEVRLAQNLAKASEVILSPNCWELCDRNLIEVDRIPDERAVKVRYIKNIPDFDMEGFLEKCSLYLRQNRISETFEVLRNASILAPNEELEKNLRKFVMRNILRKIDDNQPLEYLSELRPVTIVFVNLQFDDSANTHHLCKAIQDAYTMIIRVIHPLSGKINKLFMFDKGCTLLCIFGLPGDKQADESANALDSAHEIHAFCSRALMKVKIVSIGVTSGPVFCGVVGHRVRHEYTVIGRKVNLAARMMMYYPGIVTCDAITCAKSKLPLHFFEELPLIEMKGVLNPGTVYHFLGVSEKAMIYKAYLTRERSEYYPLLGRKKETDIFENLLMDFKVIRKSHIIMYEGPMGYGKSQLMAEMAYLGQWAGQKVVAMELAKINMCQNFFTIRTFMAMFLGIDTCKTYDARQYILLAKIHDIINEEYLCLLNNLFHVKFPTSEKVCQMNKDARNEEMERILVKILENAVEKEILILVIDEAQFIDSASWDFLDNLLKKVPIFIVMSSSPIKSKGRLPCQTAAKILNSPDTTYIHLRELTPSVIIQKACQDLGVVTIARELETFLIQRSHGNPFYCEELLRNLHLNNVLQFHLVEEDEEKEDEWDSLFRIALAELDNMNPSEQMVVKCASIIGATFTTDLLHYILPEWSKMKMYQTLAALVDSNIFQCFIERKDLKAAEFSSERTLFFKITKPAPQKSDIGIAVSNRLNQEERVMGCKIMTFCTPLLQEAAYELWLKNQKKALHLKCASYLEKHAHRCKCCGGGDFISFHRFAVEGMLENIHTWEAKGEQVIENELNQTVLMLVSETLKKLEPSKREAYKCFSLPTSRRGTKATVLESSGDTLASDHWDEFRSTRRRENTIETNVTWQDSFRAEDTEMEFLKRMDEIIFLTGMSKKNDKNVACCECEEIVESVIVPLSQHCTALGNYTRAFYYLLECASGYVHLSNNYMAFTYLNTAESMLKLLEFQEQGVNQFEESVLCSLKGEVSYNMGQINLAKKLLKKALSLLNRSFPITIVGAFFMSMVETSRHLSHQKKQTFWQISSGKQKKLAVLHLQGNCLSLLWQLFSLDLARSSKKFSRLAALMKVNCAEESHDDSQIISSYMEFSLCCQLLGYQHDWMKYELMAIRRSSFLRVVGEGLLIITKLASSLAYMKLCLGNLPLAIQLGSRAHELCEQLKKPKLDYIVLLDLFSALFFSTRFQDAVQVLSWLEELSIQHNNIIGQACFISSCLNVMLYAGFSFRSFDHCLEFVLANETNCILMSQNNIMLGLYSSLAIWFARIQEWSNFVQPFEQARRLMRRTSASLYANHGFCKFVECEVLLLRKYIEEKPDKARDLRNKVLKNFDLVMAQCSTSPIFYARVYHLKAYVQLMLDHDENSQNFLENAFQNSELYGNFLEQSWLEISKEWWFTGSCPMKDWWLKTVPDFPEWKVGMTSAEMGDFYKNKYLLKVPELDIHNQFPETTVEY